MAVLNREPARVLEFVDRVARDFNLTSIIPSHFEARIVAKPEDWAEAFDFLRKQPISIVDRALPEADLAFLRDFEKQLVESGAIRRAAPRV